jgi:hypothetical protein
MHKCGDEQIHEPAFKNFSLNTNLMPCGRALKRGCVCEYNQKMGTILNRAWAEWHCKETGGGYENFDFGDDDYALFEKDGNIGSADIWDALIYMSQSPSLTFGSIRN